VYYATDGCLDSDSDDPDDPEESFTDEVSEWLDNTFPWLDRYMPKPDAVGERTLYYNNEYFPTAAIAV